MSASHSDLLTSEAYAALLARIDERMDDIAKMFRSDVVAATNLPTDVVRINTTSGKWEKWNGATWVDLLASYGITITGSAATLTTTRTFAITGDGTATAQNFNGSQNVSMSLTLNTVPATKGGTGQTGYAIGDMVYANTTTTLEKRAIGSAGQVLTVSSGVPTWTNQSSLSVGSATNATTATNLANGSAGTLPYQTASGSTAMLAAGTAGYYLASGGAAAPVWTAPKTVTAGNGMTGGGQLTGNITLTMGTPSTLSGSTTNAVTATSHTHAISAASTSVLGVVELATSAEAIAGTDASRVITPSTLKGGLNASGSAPVYACRGWVNFDGTGTVAINAAGNITSITDNGAGDYTANFTTALPDANYAIATHVQSGASTSTTRNVNLKAAGDTSAPTTKTTSAARFNVGASNAASLIDVMSIDLLFFR